MPLNPSRLNALRTAFAIFPQGKRWLNGLGAGVGSMFLAGGCSFFSQEASLIGLRDSLVYYIHLPISTQRFQPPPALRLLRNEILHGGVIDVMPEMDLPTHTYRCLCGGGIHIDPFQAGRLSRCPRCKDFVIVPSVCGALAKKPIFELSTSRLTIQPATRRHWREIHTIYSDQKNFEYEISFPSNARETKVSIKKSAFPSGFARSNQLKFRASTTRDSRTVGTVTVAFTIPYYSVHLGFMIGRDHQGKGYGNEALSAVCNLLHMDFRVERITAMCDSRNLPCRAVLERIGFKQEGISEMFFHHPDRGWIDSSIYAFLRDSRKKPAAEQAGAYKP